MTLSTAMLSRQPFRDALVLSALGALVLLQSSAWSAERQTCRGTRFRLQVTESATTPVDRFRFSLGLEAEAETKSAAQTLLQERLARTRSAVAPLSLGQITVDAPRLYSVRGDRHGRPPLERAVTSISGVVDRSDYNALIQLAGRSDGVRLRGVTSLASEGAATSLASRLLDQALQQGRRRAETASRFLGLKHVALLSIEERSEGFTPVPQSLRASGQPFRPDEAPQPKQTLRVDLMYCLS